MRPPAYPLRGYIQISEEMAKNVLWISAKNVPNLDRVTQNFAKNVLKLNICSKKSLKIAKKSKTSRKRVGQSLYPFSIAIVLRFGICIIHLSLSPSVDSSRPFLRT